ncbi:MAG: hypothetical protein WCI73_14955 [Phycisphaerae bacterium]
MPADTHTSDPIGKIPYRMAFAGGWIDQPFVSRHNPTPPGSMVVVSLQPTCRYMERSGMATGTRRVALQLWKDGLPKGDPMKLVQELYTAENQGRPEPSGSQDMIGLIYPGVCRLDYDAAYEWGGNGGGAGIFPRHIESNTDPAVARWLEKVIHLLPVAPRPNDYNPLGQQNLDPTWIKRLGQTGKDCYNAIITRDAKALGASMNACMECWETILPGTVRHPTLTVDLPGLLKYYQRRYPGAMYSGCGGGYLYIVSEEPVPGTASVQVRTR